MNMKVTDKIARKILEPYLDNVLKACYDLRSLSYAMTYNQWCEKVNERLKENLNRKEFKKC